MMYQRRILIIFGFLIFDSSEIEQFIVILHLWKKFDKYSNRFNYSEGSRRHDNTSTDVINELPKLFDGKIYIVKAHN